MMVPLLTTTLRVFMFEMAMSAVMRSALRAVALVTLALARA